MMGKASRTKGLAGEREVAAAWQAAGLAVRNLEGSGDHLIVCANGLTLHSETKRGERWKGREWWEQTTAEAPQGTIPVMSWRPNGERWRSTLWLDDLAVIVANGTLRMPKIHLPE